MRVGDGPQERLKPDSGPPPSAMTAVQSAKADFGQLLPRIHPPPPLQPPTLLPRAQPSPMRVRLLAAVLPLLIATPAAAQGHLPWKAGDHPPAVHGVRLGWTRAEVVAALGRPASTQTLGDGGVEAMEYGGLSLVVSPEQGVAVMYLLTRGAGDVGGVRVGDSQADVLAKWGRPTRADGATAVWEVGGWMVMVQLGTREQGIVRIGLTGG
jgi:hypothetical protein